MRFEAHRLTANSFVDHLFVYVIHKRVCRYFVSHKRTAFIDTVSTHD
jgi:hypothetical protein